MAEKKKNEIQNVAEQVVKKRRERPDRQLQVDDGDNSKIMNHNMELFLLPDVDLKNPEEVQNRVVDYFKICAKNDMKPSVAGLSLAFNVSRTTLWNWVNQKNNAVADINPLKRAYNLLAAEMEDMMQNGKINPVAGIFLMKNNHGYADKTEVVVEPKNPLGEITERAALEQRYIEDATE